MEGSFGGDNGDGSFEPSAKDTIKSEKSKNSVPRDNPKSKRRSKNDSEGRNFKCNLCEKSYLSYPALYTHKKTKHPDADSGTPKPSAQSK